MRRGRFFLSMFLLAGAAAASPAGDAYRAKAMALAGGDADLVSYADKLCNSKSAPGTQMLGPVRVFDNLIFLGHDPQKWNAWALVTSAGIVIFDTQISDEEARITIVEGLKKAGLDPMQIKRIVVMHGHADHYGGAAYLHELTNAPVYLSAADWDFMLSAPQRPSGPRRPARDRIIADGQDMTLGDTTIHFVATPGHTPGTLSAIIPVTDHGQKHVVVYWGGTSYQPAKATRDQYLASVRKFRPIALEAGADVLISNHPTNDFTLLKMKALEARGPGEANPLVLGKARYARTLDILEQCTLAAQAEAEK